MQVKLPDATPRRLRQEAHTTGRCVAAPIREWPEAVPRGGSRSIYEITADLAASVAGSRKPAAKAASDTILSATPCDVQSALS